MSITPYRSLRRFGLAVAAVCAVWVLATAGTGHAVDDCYPPDDSGCVPGEGGSLTISDSTVVVGQTITATGTGFAGGSNGSLSAASDEVRVAGFTANAAGTFSVRITIPNISRGAHTLIARGTAPSGNALVLSRGFTVIGQSGDDDDGDLAVTGARIIIPATVLGLGLIVVGFVVRRRGTRRLKASL